ncbi:cytochrome c biogenesis protein CcsA [Thermoflexibacter ruber]|uniref:Cytochrome c-type biogenesis protein CcmF n=1 Tax=Thermoflexibacter ruber TaxID=1003 RepID=A0A1I2BQY0_9BACT|nr:cytochrome c biogenesis protein CcsA [Thermoflexibacter ruber]SFE58524.1 cytochrome c-type biogenesis protein CcmF [Thermoflexibacter ruber]
MLHTFVGNLGHFFVITAFVTALIAVYAYHKVSNSIDSEQISWIKFARGAFYVHGLAVVGVIAALFYIIYNHYYEYHYAWSHSSNNLPTHYMISCFWEGQEGSFLLWAFWHVLIGILLIHTSKHWEASVMQIFALVQAFLTSMILGVVLFGEMKIGSSPFLLLREVFPNDEAFQINPDFIPKDGTGLNPLLQNYWMVIHPPTLFLGFALTLVPFAFAIAGLREKKYRDWVRPALPWSHFGALVLGVGIMMGGYWAYETLNFGGYWNWDPVENAVYVPWLILVASIHVMITFQKSNIALKASFILTVTTFILILYSTFLTRSGVLGEASVHSFTDLGLSGQLLVYLLAFLGVAVFYLAKAWKDIPTAEEEVSTYSREFWIFIGATVLSLAAFQVIVATSIPAYNSLLSALGISSKVAPPADQVQFYSKFQLWAGVFIALLSGTGQFFFWKRMDKDSLWKAISVPLILTMLTSSVFILITEIKDWKHIILLTVCLYSLISNLSILIKLAKSNVKLVGGSVAHIGVALMLLGILASAGYSKVISLNNTGFVYNKNFPDEMNKENLLLFRHKPQKMKDYTLTYKGTRMESKEFPTYIDQEVLRATAEPHRMITSQDLVYKGKTYFTKGDTLQVFNENTYYEIEYKKDDGQVFTLYPRVQINPQMGTVVSPDISRYWRADLYTHVTNIPDPEEEKKWSEPEKYNLVVGDTFIVNDYIAIFDNVYQGERTQNADAVVYANIRILGRDKDYTLKPAYLINLQQSAVQKQPDTNVALGIRVAIEEIKPPTEGTNEPAKFIFSASTTQQDWIILKAIEMPFINILWTGVILVSIGFGIATVRRYQEFKNLKEKQNKEKREKELV